MFKLILRKCYEAYLIYLKKLKYPINDPIAKNLSSKYLEKPDNFLIF